MNRKTSARTLTSTLALVGLAALFVATSEVESSGVRDDGPDFALTLQSPTRDFGVEALGSTTDATDGTTSWALFLDVSGEDDASLSVRITDCAGETLDDAELAASLAGSDHSVSFDGDYTCSGSDCSAQICVTFQADTPVDVDWTVSAVDNRSNADFDELIIRADP